MVRSKYQKMGRGLAFMASFALIAAMIIYFALASRTSPFAWDLGLGQQTANDTVTVLRTATDEVMEMDFKTYLTGVVASEMSPTFELEALKAQAIVARTFTLRRLANSHLDADSRGHESALCDDYGHCQAYRGEEDNRERWGENHEAYMARCREAVEATEDIALIYAGELAATFYHSTCGGKTASAEEVWGQAYPYLIPVDCSWDQSAPRYEAEAVLSLAQLPYLLGDGTTPCIALPEGEQAAIVPETSGKTESGRIANVIYGELSFPATAFRQKTGINSTAFSFYAEGDALTVYTRGYGHGVGLCQQGANGMAKEGYVYEEILTHYYPGTSIAPYDSPQS